MFLVISCFEFASHGRHPQCPKHVLGSRPASHSTQWMVPKHNRACFPEAPMCASQPRCAAGQKSQTSSSFKNNSHPLRGRVGRLVRLLLAPWWVISEVCPTEFPKEVPGDWGHTVMNSSIHPYRLLRLLLHTLTILPEVTFHKSLNTQDGQGIWWLLNKGYYSERYIDC